MAKLVLRNWRVVEAQPSGMYVWFDPCRERVELFELEEPTAEAGVGEPGEGDDQRGLFDAQYPGNREVVESDDLPF